MLKASRLIRFSPTSITCIYAITISILHSDFQALIFSPQPGPVIRQETSNRGQNTPRNYSGRTPRTSHPYYSGKTPRTRHPPKICRGSHWTHGIPTHYLIISTTSCRYLPWENSQVLAPSHKEKRKTGKLLPIIQAHRSVSA